MGWVVGWQPPTGPRSVPCTHNTHLGSSSGPGWASGIVTCFLTFFLLFPNHTFPTPLCPFVRVAQALLGAHLTPGILVSVYDAEELPAASLEYQYCPFSITMKESKNCLTDQGDQVACGQLVAPPTGDATEAPEAVHVQHPGQACA